jgi:glutathione peroxidase
MNDTAAAPRSAYDFEATSITGQAIPLSDYRGKVLLAAVRRPAGAA